MSIMLHPSLKGGNKNQISKEATCQRCVGGRTILIQKGRFLSKVLLILLDDKMNPVTKRDIFPLSSERRKFCSDPTKEVCKLLRKNGRFVVRLDKGEIRSLLCNSVANFRPMIYLACPCL